MIFVVERPGTRSMKCLARVIAALGVDGRAHLFDQRLCRRLVEEHDVVDGDERAHDRRAVKLRVDGARLALQAAHGSVGIESEHKAVAQGTRRFQITHMTCMQDVEATVREDDALPRFAQRCAEVLDPFLRYQHVNPPKMSDGKLPHLPRKFRCTDRRRAELPHGDT